MNMEELLKGIQDCICGKNHLCPVEHVMIGKNVLGALKEICLGYQNILLVSNQNTYQVCRREVSQILGEKITSSIMFGTGEKPLIPNEEAIEAIHAKFIGDHGDFRRKTLSCAWD